MSKSMKGIDAVEKVQLVEEYLSGRISRSTAIKKVGINESTFRLWLRLYRTSGPTALIPLKKNKYYSNELKIKVVKEYLSGGLDIINCTINIQQRYNMKKCKRRKDHDKKNKKLHI